MTKRILTVDDEPWITKMIHTVLEKQGYTLESAANGREGLQKAIHFLPDLIIADVMMPEMNGWAFIRSLRSHSKMALVPVIFLTGLNSEDDRILGFRLGADDYISKPFRFEELELRVAKVLRQSERLRQEVQSQMGPEKAGAGFSGDLSQLGLSALLTLLDLERKSGVLVLQGERTGRIFLRGGRVIAACFDGSALPRGVKVILELLTWSRGRFWFSALEVQMSDELDRTTTHLLMECTRLLDEQL